MAKITVNKSFWASMLLDPVEGPGVSRYRKRYLTSLIGSPSMGPAGGIPYYYLSLGSNLGNRGANIEAAIAYLKGFGDVLRVSPVYETEPVGMEPGTGYFLNLALCFRSALSPGALLDKIKRFEKQMGRDLSNSHNRSRTIDVDILLMDDGGPGIVDTETLTIPHKEMCNRAFVLVPLNDIAPDAVHPIRGKRIDQLLACLDAPEAVWPVKK